MRFFLKSVVVLLAVSFVSCIAISKPIYGGYRDSCKKCDVKNGYLRCKCADRNGNKIRTSLKLSNCDTVDNIDGELQCTSYTHSHEHRYNVTHKFNHISAGPIWNQYDANNKCPAVCSERGPGWKWNGQWRTVSEGTDSKCECIKKHHH